MKAERGRLITEFIKRFPAEALAQVVPERSGGRRVLRFTPKTSPSVVDESNSKVLQSNDARLCFNPDYSQTLIL